MDLLVNLDVPDLQAAEAFYTQAFALKVTRRFGGGAVELTGWPARLYLLQNPAGSPGAGGHPRRYDRHWCPIHLDVVVEDLDAALSQALAAGAAVETPVRDEIWGRIITLADPFGHGLCLIQFQNRGYDEVADPA